MVNIDELTAFTTEAYEYTANYVEVCNMGNEKITLSCNNIDKNIEAGLSGIIQTAENFAGFAVYVPVSSKHTITVGLA
jgi:hypothetical protein